MLVPENQVKQLLSLTTQTVREIAIEAHKYIGTHEKIRGYCKYPVLHHFFPKDQPEFKEMYERIPLLIYDIPQYELKDFPEDRIQYGAIFDGYNSDTIKILDFEKFKELYQYIIDNNELRKAFFKDESKPSEYQIKTMIKEIVERYMYSINADASVPEDIEAKIRPFIAEKLKRYVYESLKIDIYVPINLVTFENDKIVLNENIEIVRMPESVQKSRKKACVYESAKEEDVAASATHMIVLRNYCIKNKEFTYINDRTRRYTAYPLDIIDNIMVAIRIVTGYSVGYEQVLTAPVDWVDGICTDLIPLYGAKVHFVNPKELEKNWMDLSIGYIDKKQGEEIKNLFVQISDFMNGDNSNVLFALKRLNRCMLRNEVDDMAIDASIGLEALLAGGSKGEITYKISNRIPIVFKSEKSEIYESENCREIMCKIYNYRSKVVHGERMKEKDMFYQVNGKKMPIEKIAVDFLRHTLLFILHNPEYVNAKKFDESIDALIFDNNN